MVAQRRAGIVTTRELQEAGWTPSAVTWAVHVGRLHRVAPGVFRTDGTPFSRSTAHHAALAIVPSAVIARWTAAELHGFREQRRGPIELILPHRRRPPVPVDELFRATRTRHLPDDERCEVDGLAVTTPARTLMDLAGTMSTSRLAEVVAAALRRRACRIEDVTRVLDRHPRARGRQRLREALALLGSDGVRSRSDDEVKALTELVQAGLPRPVLGHIVVLDERGRVAAELDLAYPELTIAIEVDGFRWHSSPAQKRADEERQNRLVVAGWTVLRFSAMDVRHRPQHVVGVVRAAIEVARARS